MKIIYLMCVWLAGCYAEDPIRYAAVVFRHGDRTPVDTYPTDPWRNESLWPVKFGELTNTGKQQHYALGQWLRKRYSNLISEKFDPTQLEVISTNVDRTLMSAQANLAGMYPPVGSAIWNPKLLWQPIPIHTKPEAEDEVLAMKKTCALYNKEVEKMIKSRTYQDKLRQYQDLMNFLTAYTGKKIQDFYDIETIYSSLYIESLYNFKLPNWTTTVYPDKMREPACFSFTTSAATPTMARLRGGPLLKDIFSKIEKVIVSKQKKTLKLSVYSGHDFTIGTLLTAMGLFDGKCPVYTATVLIELLQNSNQIYYIRVSYRNSTEIVEPYILTIPYCGKRCTVPRFQQMYRNLLTVDFDKECMNVNHVNTDTFGMSGFFLLLLVVIALVLGCYMRMRKLRESARSSETSESFIKQPSADNSIRKTMKV